MLGSLNRDYLSIFFLIHDTSVLVCVDESVCMCL